MTENKEPYGPASTAHYADIGYQADKKKRYPLNSSDHVRSAWSYINHPDNAAKYSPEELALIKGRIKAAAKKFGITIEEDKKMAEHRSDDLLAVLGVETRSANITIGDVDFPQGIITVVAVPYEQPTQVAFAGGVWNEVFSRSALENFDPSKRRVPATASLTVPNPNHDKGHLVGRIVEARSTDEGLVTDVKISRTPAGTETLELANDHMLSASIGFLVKDPRRDQELDRYTQTRRIHRAFLDHLAFVAEPAYAGARVLAVRSEPDLPIVDTPFVNDFADDPIFAWANSRMNR